MRKSGGGRLSACCWTSVLTGRWRHVRGAAMGCSLGGRRCSRQIYVIIHFITRSKRRRAGDVAQRFQCIDVFVSNRMLIFFSYEIIVRAENSVTLVMQHTLLAIASKADRATRYPRWTCGGHMARPVLLLGTHRAAVSCDKRNLGRTPPIPASSPRPHECVQPQRTI
jgi:hypothetical protein